jgi:hypothetical protein
MTLPVAVDTTPTRGAWLADGFGGPTRVTKLDGGPPPQGAVQVQAVGGDGRHLRGRTVAGQRHQPPSGPADAVAGLVEGDPPHPRLGLVVGGDPLPVEGGLGEGVLGHVLGLGQITQEGVHLADHALVERRVKRIKAFQARHVRPSL